jgi:hypothetical protein
MTDKSLSPHKHWTGRFNDKIWRSLVRISAGTTLLGPFQLWKIISIRQRQRPSKSFLVLLSVCLSTLYNAVPENVANNSLTIWEAPHCHRRKFSWPQSGQTLGRTCLYVSPCAPAQCLNNWGRDCDRTWSGCPALYLLGGVLLLADVGPA